VGRARVLLHRGLHQERRPALQLAGKRKFVAAAAGRGALERLRADERVVLAIVLRALAPVDREDLVAHDMAGDAPHAEPPELRRPLAARRGLGRMAGPAERERLSSELALDHRVGVGPVVQGRPPLGRDLEVAAVGAPAGEAGSTSAGARARAGNASAASAASPPSVAASPPTVAAGPRLTRRAAAGAPGTCGARASRWHHPRILG
jgi:hypothetical protein